jgi:hypothetical protein
MQFQFQFQMSRLGVGRAEWEILAMEAIFCCFQKPSVHGFPNNKSRIIGDEIDVCFELLLSVVVAKRGL